MSENEIVLNLKELSCQHCIKAVKKALEAIDGVESAEVSLQQAIIKGNAEPQKLVKAIMEAGYYAEIAIQ
ncbi:cation transporter [Seminibacterium arietis]|uniref:Cation transporter n=1 Tax=Seminibacterium arietis TaxID=1173502 RepID=A0ABW3IAG6_9PAST